MKTRGRILIIVGLILGNFMFGAWHWPAESKQDHTRILSTSIPLEHNPRVMDIAMLGAHDAFSHEINLFSEVDPAESSSSLLNQTLLRLLLPGLFVRYAKAQSVGTEALLKAGVRYLDIRTSFHRDTWMTKHGLISGTLASYIEPVLTFLDTYPGEFIILDFQHTYLGQQTPEAWIEALSLIKVEGKNIFDFVHYDTDTPLDQLRYHDVTNHRLTSGLIILLPFEKSLTESRHYHRQQDVIRSSWHNTASMNTLIEGIQNEHQAILVEANRSYLAVNQAQRTGVFSGSGIVDTLFGWSLLSMARQGNPQLANHPEFENWLTTMPIFMVDYATSEHQNFNAKVNHMISAYNANLI